MFELCNTLLSEMGNNVMGRYVIMALFIKDTYYNKIYGRKYYLVNYEDGSKAILLTTNEPINGYDKYDFDQEYILIHNIKQMLEDFEKTELIGLLIPSKIEGPPKYIYYNIITINDNLKSHILNHLDLSIAKLSPIDLNQIEKEQINQWRLYLSK